MKSILDHNKIAWSLIRMNREQDSKNNRSTVDSKRNPIKINRNPCNMNEKPYTPFALLGSGLAGTESLCSVQQGGKDVGGTRE